MRKKINETKKEVEIDAFKGNNEGRSKRKTRKSRRRRRRQKERIRGEGGKEDTLEQEKVRN